MNPNFSSTEREMKTLDTGLDKDPRVDEGLLNEKSTPSQVQADSSSTSEILAAVSAASLNIQVGLIIAYAAILVPELTKEDSEIPVTQSEVSWISSMVSLVGPLGSFLGGACMQWTGRIKTMYISLIPYLLGWIIVATSQNVYQIVLGRCLLGISMCLGHNASYVYIAEVSRPRLRGSLMSVGSLFVSLGMLLTYLQGYLTPHWRVSGWVCMIYGMIPYLAIMLSCTPSPVWLVTGNRIEDARKSLKYLVRTEKAAEEISNMRLNEIVAEEQLKEKLNDNRTYVKKFLDTVRKPQTYKPFWILIVLFFLQQFTGVYIILVYAIDIFKAMGSKLDPYVSSIWLGVLRLVMGVVTTYILRSYGRRKVCIVSGSIMMVTMTVSGYFIHKGLHQQHSLKWVPVVCILVFISAATPGIMTLPWMISAELFPSDVRGIIQGPIMAWANIVSFAALKLYPSMDGILGGVDRVHWFFGTTSLVTVIFIWLFLPETHNRRLIEIEHHFQRNGLPQTDCKLAV